MGVRRALIALPAVLAVLFASQAQADTRSGLNYVVYDNWTGQNNAYNNAPPLPPTTPIVDSGIVNQINHDWGGGQILDTDLHDDVVIRYEGWLLPPTEGTFYVCALADDGFILELDGIPVIDDWYDKGPSCGQTADLDYTDGQPKELVAWWYENGGGAVSTLLYYTDSGWEVVPAGWYFRDEPAPTVTTTTTTTTSTTTTTTSPEQAAEAERKEEQRRDYEKATECEKVNHAFESCPLWPGRTSTSTSTVPETTTTSTTTTSTVPETTTSLTTTTSSSTSVPETTVPATTVPATTVPETTVPETTVPATTIPTVEPAPPPQPAAEAAAQATAAALTILTEPDTLATLPVEQLEEVFAALEPELMTAAEGEAIAQALNKAPKKAKKAFQENVNVFAGIFDSFVMADQKIPVEDRRTLIAVANTMAALGTVLTRRRQ